MTIKPDTTFAQFEVELGKLGITSYSWGVHERRHFVKLYGYDASQTAEGFGMTMIEAIDDAITAWTQALGAMLARAD